MRFMLLALRRQEQDHIQRGSEQSPVEVIKLLGIHMYYNSCVFYWSIGTFLKILIAASLNSHIMKDELKMITG